MVDGLMRRFANANESPPKLLYTDRDCCNANGPSKYQALFSGWPDLLVRLDIWHFMRRLASGCTTESHSLYGPFMSTLSSCIFEWDSSDVGLLRQAKREEIISKTNINMPTDSAISKAIRKSEMGKHCRRKTRDTSVIISKIGALIDSFSSATDSLGVPIFRDEMSEIWAEQKKHVNCIQDPPGMSLYCKTGSLVKGKTELPVFRCGRGSTSLESFHLHLNRFIPGKHCSLLYFY